MTDVVPLTEKQFNDLIKDLPEDGFATLIPLLMESFSKKRGRTLDRTQVAVLAVGLLEMSGVIDLQGSYIGELQTQVKKPKNELWRPDA